MDESRTPWRGFLHSFADAPVAAPQHIRSVPSSALIEERWNRRKAILEETKDHLLLHPHNGLGDTGRNIAFVLCDREARGAQFVTLLPRWQRYRPRSETERKEEEEEEESRSSLGDRSPSTVLESPLQRSMITSPSEPMSIDSVGSPALNAVSTPPTETAATALQTLNRRVTYPFTVAREIRTFVEYAAVTRNHSAFLTHLGGDDVLDEEGHWPASSKAVSTISIAFCPDGTTMASTHGDHTVKITCCSTGRLLQSLEGHPRTPWTVKYHPTDPFRLASGCLGHQVRLWNWQSKLCLQMIRLEFAIISLAFHPSGTLLAIANGTRLHFWGIPENEHTQDDDVDDHSDGAMDDAPAATLQPRTPRLTELDQRHMLRCVHFPPNGTTLILGGVNPVTDDPRRPAMTFYLRLWDFDVALALRPPTAAAPRQPISNPRTFVPRALLYNDGGFDLDASGQTLCVCAEYFLPEGVHNAMELLQKEQLALDQQQESEALERRISEVNCEEEERSVSSRLPRSPNISSQGRSVSFRDGMDVTALPPSNAPALLGPPPSLNTEGAPGCFIPRTPPPVSHTEPRFRTLSPPPPPGSRFMARGILRTTRDSNFHATSTSRGAPPRLVLRPPHPLSVLQAPLDAYHKGRYVPHVVTVSLDTTPLQLETAHGPRGAVARGYRPRLGQLLEACPLDASKASAITCVKFSPSADFCLIGYGVREPLIGGGNLHPVTAVYRVRGGMEPVSTMLSGDDDVNIARFHPDSGHSFVYGTKQGRVRVLSPRPWNF